MHQSNADFGGTSGSLQNVYLIANDVEGLEHGSYRQGVHGLELIEGRDLRSDAEELALKQQLAGEAALNVYFLADLLAVLADCGNRGYRAAQLEAGIRAGRLYLGAYAVGLRASGLTFYDEAVMQLFRASTMWPMFLVAIG